MAPETTDAGRMRTEALRLDTESREHKRREGRERKRAREKRQRVDELLAECARLGIVVHLYPAGLPSGSLDSPDSDLAREAALQQQLQTNHSQPKQEGTENDSQPRSA